MAGATSGSAVLCTEETRIAKTPAESPEKKGVPSGPAESQKQSA